MTAASSAGWTRLRPARADSTDVAFSLLLVGLGIVGFDAAFGGPEAFTVGLPAVVCGVLVGYVVGKLRLPVLLAAAIGVAACFLLSGAVALRDDAIGGVLPTPAVWADLADGALNGWVRLVTTVPPAGQAGNLLAIPYLTGFVGGFLTIVAAVAARARSICLLPPLGVLVLSVLFGVNEPASLLLQGALFGVGAISWLSLRADRTTRPAATQASSVRAVGGVALLGVGVLGAFVVGPRLPMADAKPRYVLREHVQPPFDPSQYPSPLGRFRQFDGKQPIEEPLFTVEGMPAGHRVRVAVMDAYDGYVWRAAAPGSAVGGSYQRVGDEIPGAAAGEAHTLEFRMGALAHRDSVWVPTAGSPTSIRFAGPNSSALTESFRFNRATDTAASPRALVEGDVWQVDTNFPEVRPPEELAALQAASVPVDPPAGFSENTALVELVDTWTAGATSPYERVRRIADALAAIGAHNSGDDPAHPIAAGHSLARLVPFITSVQPQGNDEQFAAAVAYLARGAGIPARVVLTFEVEDGVGPVPVGADDAHATVEVALDEVGWVALPDIVPANEPQSLLAKEIPEDAESVQPPPPTTIAPPASIPEEPEPDESRSQEDEEAGGAAAAFGVVLTVLKVAAVPLIVVAGPPLLIGGLKARRRRRRRRNGVAARRIAAAWDEVVDLTRDLGTSVPPRATRRELARLAPLPAVAPLAADVDEALFGSAEPDEAHAAELWGTVDDVRAELLANLGPVARYRTAANLTSLRSRR